MLFFKSSLFLILACAAAMVVAGDGGKEHGEVDGKEHGESGGKEHGETGGIHGDTPRAGGECGSIGDDCSNSSPCCTGTCVQTVRIHKYMCLDDN